MIASLPPLSLLACSVCFSTDGERSRAYLAVTLVLLGLTFGLALAGGLWVWHLERRTRGE